MSMENLLQILFNWNVRNKNIVIDVFKIGYFLIIITLVFTAYFLARHERIIGVYAMGELSGKIAISLFCLTIMPGILKRFAVRNVVISLIMLYRRHLGISTFAFAFYHYAAIRLFPMLFGGDPFILWAPLFEVFGVISLYTMSLLFFTSNAWSVQKFGKWWGRIHSLIYCIAWTIFGHVFLQEVSSWTILIGVFATLETVSLIYFYSRKNTVTEK